jgi:hypothetical protein
VLVHSVDLALGEGKEQSPFASEAVAERRAGHRDPCRDPGKGDTVRPDLIDLIGQRSENLDPFVLV